MPWYTTEDARRDALKQSAEKERAGCVEAKSGAINPACSSFCAVGEPCAIAADGRCDAELTHNAIAQGREHSEHPAGAEG